MRRIFTRIAVALLLGIASCAAVVVGAPVAGAAAPACGSVILAGSQWLGGTGADVHSNGPQLQGKSDSCGGESHSNPSGQYGYAWQCVELAARLYYIKGWGTVYAGGNGGAAYIPEGSRPALTFYANGSGYVPVPGDLIIFNATSSNAYGHVAIVDTVAGGTINDVEQNASLSGRGTLSISGSTISGNVRGVVHSPKNTNKNGGSGSPSSGLMMMLNGDSSVSYKANATTDSWHTVVSPGGAKAISVGGGQLGMIDSCGAVEAKTMTSGWNILTSCNSAKQIVMGSDGSILLLQVDGSVLYKPSISAAWQVHANSGAATAIAMGGGQLGMIDSCGAFAVKHTLTSSWAAVTGCNSARQIALGSDGSLMLLLPSNTAIYMPQWGQAWQTQTSTGDAQMIADNYGELAIVNGCGAVLVKQTANSGFATLTSCGSAKAVTIGSQGDILLLQVDGSVLYKSNVGTAWLTQVNPADTKAALLN